MMHSLWICLTLSVFSAGLACAQQRAAGGNRGPVPQLQETGFRSIFDGKSLDNWDYDPNFWRLEQGVLTGETRADHQPKYNIFAIWKGGEPADFELKLEYRLTGESGNSGVQYRSAELPEVGKWVLKGYQADIDGKQQYTGQIYEERGRGFLALRGQLSYVPEGQKVGYIASTGSSDELKGAIKDADWNELHIIARGNTVTQMINCRVMSGVIDDDKANRKSAGKIGIQLHVTTAPMKIEARNIRLKTY